MIVIVKLFLLRIKKLIDVFVLIKEIQYLLQNQNQFRNAFII